MQSTEPPTLFLSTADPAVPRIAARITAVAAMFGTSSSTVRRAEKNDPTFPRPFRLTPNGDLLWAVADIQAYVAAKSARVQADEKPVGSPVEDRSGTEPKPTRRSRAKARPYRAGMAGDADAGEAA
jgi:predicted DNA-binding transcriptional regulator AlpA